MNGFKKIPDTLKHLPIQTKLLVALVAVALVNGLFAVFFFPSQQARQTEEAFRGEVESLARTVALGIAIGMETGDLSGVQRSMDFAKANPNVRFVYLESDGEKLAAFPEDFELTDEVQATDSLVIASAPIDSEALPGQVYIGESNAAIRAAIGSTRFKAFLVALGLLVAGVVAAILLARMVVGPLRGALAQINDLAEGRLHRVEEPERNDEVGQMLVALNRTIEGLRGALEADEVDWDEIARQRRREAELREAEARRIAEEREEVRRQQVKVDEVLSVVRSASSGDLTRSVAASGEDALDKVGQGLNRFFEDLRGSMQELNRNADTLSSAASALSSVTDGIRGEAHRTLGRARDASGAAGRVNDNVRSVAAATEEMAATIREISRSAAHAAEVARSGVEMARSTNVSMEQLGQSSTEIGTVVEVIASIAEKTNLLALNATIEAARAGEAGKGFAVVATEVKQLATQSARAAQEIAEKVGAIQSDSTEAVSALDAITRIIVEIDEIQSTIASAVEEQTATTGEIGRSLEDTAAATQEITSTVASVAESAERTSASVASAAASVEEVEAMSTSLAGLVGRFKVDESSRAAPRKREAELVA